MKFFQSITRRALGGMLLAVLVSRYMGMREFAAINGQVAAVFGLGVGFGPALSSVVVDATAFKSMLTQAKDRTKLTYRFDFGNAGSILSKFVINSIQLTGAHNDAQTFSASMASDGTPTITLPT